jgi:P27 family predicted phage terminase small subunit
MARPRKPTMLKVVGGTAQKCRTNRREPKPQRGVPTAPKHLSERARKAWTKLAAMTDKMGILTKSDPIALEMLCCSYCDWQEARESLAQPLIITVKEDGEDKEVRLAEGGDRYYYTHGKGGAMRRIRPEVSDIAEAERRLAMWLSKFGLTPADRSRVSSVQAPQNDGNPFAGF